MSTKVRLAVIGSGGISLAHADGILQYNDKVECAAICDVSESNLDAFAKKVGNNPRRFNDWKKMLAEMGGEIDAVDICLPHHLHAPAIFDAAAAGKHILCEKPMCISLDEADRIVEAVRKAGIIYMSAHNQLFTPALIEMKRMIDAGELGKVFWIRSQDAFVLPANVMEGKWRREIKHQGGGELIDTGYHPTYRLIYLAGSAAVAVRGTMGRFRIEMEGEDTASVQVRFANGIIGEIFTSWAVAKPHGTHDLHIIGEKGEVFGSGSDVFHLPKDATAATQKSLPVVNTYAVQIGHFADCIRNGTRPPHGPEEGREVLRLILDAAKSADGWQAGALVKP